MKRILVTIAAIALIAVGLWAARNFLDSLKRPDSKAAELVARLDGLYRQSEEIESKIRALQSQSQSYETEQHALELVRESIEAVRSEIRQQNEESRPAPKSTIAIGSMAIGKLRSIPIRTIWIALGVVAFVALIVLISALRRQLFGQTVKRPPFTRAIPVTKKARPAPEPARTIPEKQNEREEEPESVRPIEEPRPAAVSRNPERQPAGSLNEQILEFYRQGLTIKEISNRLKVGLDQVALVVRLQSKP